MLVSMILDFSKTAVNFSDIHCFYFFRMRWAVPKLFIHNYVAVLTSVNDLTMYIYSVYNVHKWSQSLS